MKEKIAMGDSLEAAVRSSKALGGNVAIVGEWTATARDADGKVKWVEKWKNLVTNEGLDHLLDVTLSGATQNTTWYVGLTDGTPTEDATDVMSSHVGWVEVTAYDEAARPTWTEAGVSSQSITNSASTATFTIDTNSTTVGGAFLTSNSTKGGTTGVLYAVGDFTGGDKSLDDNDTLDVTATFTTAAA